MYLRIDTLHKYIKKHNILLLIGSYRVENRKSEPLFNSIKDAVGRIDDQRIVKFNVKMGHPTWFVLRLEYQHI